MLKSKKHNSQSEWVAAWNASKIMAKTPEGASRAEYLIDTACRRVPTESTVYGWSGGKDTLALQVVVERCGVERGVIGTIGWRWEYPSFKRFVMSAKPSGVVVRDFGYTAEWMNENPRFVFPESSKDAYYWFTHCNQAAYYGYAKEVGADNVVLGHRTADGNVCGGGEMVSHGVRKVFPLHDWSHEDVFLVVAYAQIGLPEIYFEDGGFYQGTHAWPMRTGGRRAMEEIWRINPSILKSGADIDKVREFVNEMEAEK